MAAEVLRERAPAKVNLTLHIKGRRADGYHDLESMVVFAGVHDLLTLEPADSFALAVSGPRAEATGPLTENLILKAARLLDERLSLRRKGRFALLKRLPAAAGIGGGSADAAAALRLLCRVNGIPLFDSAVLDAARHVGADVPVCLRSSAQMMRGVGEQLEPQGAFRGLFAVLVNPGVGVETKAAFQALGLKPGEDRGLPPHPVIGADAIAAIAPLRNDFEPTAIAMAPVIAEVLSMLRAAPGHQLARMSGSGATCFGVYENCHAAAAAARTIRARAPHWWVEPTLLR